MPDEYINLDQLVRGCVSGRISEWPMLKQEAKNALAEISRLCTALEAAERERDRLRTKIARWASADLRVSESESKTYLGKGILALMQDIRAALAGPDAARTREGGRQ